MTDRLFNTPILRLIAINYINADIRNDLFKPRISYTFHIILFSLRRLPTSRKLVAFPISWQDLLSVFEHSPVSDPINSINSVSRTNSFISGIFISSVIESLSYQNDYLASGVLIAHEVIRSTLTELALVIVRIHFIYLQLWVKEWYLFTAKFICFNPPPICVKS